MTDWGKLTVKDLKAELKQRGLEVGGLKADLVKRLEEDDKKTTRIATDQSEDKENLAIAMENGEVGNGTPMRQAEKSESSSAPTDPEAVVPQPSVEPSEEKSIFPEKTMKAASAEPAKDVIPPVLDEKKATADIPSLQRVDTTEFKEDIEKRKRRSLSPPPIDAAAAKRVKLETKISDNGAIKTTEADAEWVEGHNNVDTAMANASSTEVATEGGVEPGPTIIDTSQEEVVVELAAGARPGQANANGETKSNTEMDTKGDADIDIGIPSVQVSKNIKNNKFADADIDVDMADYDDDGDDDYNRGRSPLRSPAHNSFIANGPSYTINAIKSVPARALSPEGTTEPAIHPATNALYIRNFQRPLNQYELRSHIANLASPSTAKLSTFDTSSDSDNIDEFYLDLLCTHAFIIFTTVNSAIRVRSAIHNRVYPPGESTRAKLWADFIPEGRVAEWIKMERDSPRSTKWMVEYFTSPDSGEVEVGLRESVGVLPAQLPKHSSTSDQYGFDGAGSRERFANAPRGPRADFGGNGNGNGYGGAYGGGYGGAPPRGPAARVRSPGASSTTITSPILTLIPVSESVVAQRLHQIASYTLSFATFAEAARAERSGIHRYSFDRGSFVDRGVEVFEGVRKPRGVKPVPLPLDVTRGGRMPADLKERLWERDRAASTRYHDFRDDSAFGRRGRADYRARGGGGGYRGDRFRGDSYRGEGERGRGRGYDRGYDRSDRSDRDSRYGGGGESRRGSRYDERASGSYSSFKGTGHGGGERFNDREGGRSEVGLRGGGGARDDFRGDCDRGRGGGSAYDDVKDFASRGRGGGRY